MALMRGAQRIMRQSVMRHQQQHASCGRYAGERPGRKAHQQADIDQPAKKRQAALRCQHVHRGLIGAQIQARRCESRALPCRRTP